MNHAHGDAFSVTLYPEEKRAVCCSEMKFDALFHIMALVRLLMERMLPVCVCRLFRLTLRR